MTSCKKNAFVFNFRISQLRKSVQYAYRSKNLFKVQHVPTAFSSKRKYKKLAFAVRVHRLFHVVVLQRTAKKCAKIQNARTKPLLDALVAVAGLLKLPK